MLHPSTSFSTVAPNISGQSTHRARIILSKASFRFAWEKSSGKLMISIIRSAGKECLSRAFNPPRKIIQTMSTIDPLSPRRSPIHNTLVDCKHKLSLIPIATSQIW